MTTLDALVRSGYDSIARGVLASAGSGRCRSFWAVPILLAHGANPARVDLSTEARRARLQEARDLWARAERWLEARESAVQSAVPFLPRDLQHVVWGLGGPSVLDALEAEESAGAKATRSLLRVWDPQRMYLERALVPYIALFSGAFLMDQLYLPWLTVPVVFMATLGLVPREVMDLAKERCGWWFEFAPVLPSLLFIYNLPIELEWPWGFAPLLAIFPFLLRLLPYLRR
jgi:hypothetical protein